MKSMNIAASSELVSRLSTHRRVVALGDTDFTDVAAVVITAADSRSGILTLLKRTGFHLPVFLYSEHAVELPAGVTAVINGNEQQWLELESAACQYEENLLPPFYDTLTQYVEMGNSTFACYSAAIFLIPICISFDTAEKRRYATYLILNRRFSFEF